MVAPWSFVPFNGQTYTTDCESYTHISGYKVGSFQGEVKLAADFTPVVGEFYYIYINQIPHRFKFLSYSTTPKIDFLQAVANAIKTVGVCDAQLSLPAADKVVVSGYNNSFVGALPANNLSVSITGDGLVFTVTQAPGQIRTIKTGSVCCFADSYGEAVINPTLAMEAAGTLDEAMIAGIAIARVTDYNLNEFYQTDAFSRLYTPAQTMPILYRGLFYYQLPNAKINDTLKVVIGSTATDLQKPGDIIRSTDVAPTTVTAVPMAKSVLKVWRGATKEGYAILSLR